MSETGSKQPTKLYSQPGGEPRQAPSQHTKRSRARKKILDHSVTTLPITLVYPSTPAGGGCEEVFPQNLPGVLSFQD